MNPFLSIITVTYNPGLEALTKTIHSVTTQTLRKQIEYLVIDGESTDGTVEYCREHHHDIDVFFQKMTRVSTML